MNKESEVDRLKRTGRADAGRYFAEIDDLRHRPNWGSLVSPTSIIEERDRISREQAIRFFTKV